MRIQFYPPYDAIIGAPELNLELDNLTSRLYSLRTLPPLNNHINSFGNADSCVFCIPLLLLC